MNHIKFSIYGFIFQTLVTFFLFANGYHLPIKVFEISKPKLQDSQVNDQSYDPQLTIVAQNRKKKDLKNLALYLVKKLHSESDDDSNYSGEKSVFIDKTRSLPVIILPENHAMNRKEPGNYRILHKLLHSALRSNGAEDRTAAPRHHVNYVYDYY